MRKDEPRVTLQDAWEKLRWARQHFEPLRRAIEEFQQRDSHTLSVQIDKDAGQYAFYVSGLETPDPDWGLQIGDCLHNARTALDYLMVRLIAFATGQDPKDIREVQFPIFSSPEKFNSRMGHLGKDPLLSGYLTRLEELQTFQNGNPSIWGVEWLDGVRVPRVSPLPEALSLLSQLDNVDKHRVVHAVWNGNAVFAPKGAAPGIPPDFKLVTESLATSPLEDGAEVGSMFFATPLPHDWHPDEVQMKSYYPLEVSLDEPLIVKAVLEIVPYCLGAVGAVLRLFDPMFTHGTPPSPVTTLPSQAMWRLSPVRPLPRFDDEAFSP
jgi:hypothetical protein